MRRCRPRHGQIAVEHLDNLEPEERNRVYKMLDLKLLAHEDSNLAVEWTLGGNLCRNKEPLPRSLYPRDRCAVQPIETTHPVLHR